MNYWCTFVHYKTTISPLTICFQYFAEEGNKLFRSVREFVGQVPDCQLRSELMMYLEQIPSHCQQLNFTTKSPSAGKSSTFNKVRKTMLYQDHVVILCWSMSPYLWPRGLRRLTGDAKVEGLNPDTALISFGKILTCTCYSPPRC